MCIVGDDAKAGVGGILLHDATERHLCGGSHGIRFVEDDEFVVAEDLEVPRFRRGREDLFGALKGTNPSVMQRDGQALVSMPLVGRRRTCKGLDLFSNHVNSSIIASVELQNHLPHVFIAIDSPRQG